MIQVRQLRKSFQTQEDRVAAVNGVDFTVSSGKFFTLLGPSGCGKSTSLRSLAGLERPDSGEIVINGTTVFSSSANIFVPTNQRAIGMVFQSYAIWPHMTVFGNVAYPLKVKGRSKAEITRRVHETLELVGLSGLAERAAPRLSGGQQQRVALARALVAEPAVLLLDEPLSNLDAKLRGQMRTELKRLQSRLGITTVYVTHDQDEALAMSDEVAVMNLGRIVQSGAPGDIYHRPLNRFTAEFIGSTNLIDGHVQMPVLHPGTHRVETALGPLLATVHQEIQVPSRRIWISIRPEAITCLDQVAADPPVNTLNARVEQLTFLGDSVDCDARVGGRLFRLKVSSFRQLAVNAEVQLQMPPEQCVLVADDGAPGAAALEEAAAAAEVAGA